MLGGILTDSLSWHWIFLVNVPVGIAVFALSAAWEHVVRSIAKRRVLVVGTGRVAHATPDGYTTLFSSLSLLVNAILLESKVK